MLTTLIGLGRVVLGLTILYSPRRAAQMFGLPAAEVNPSLALVSRLTGNRELILGGVLLLAPRSHRATLLRTCAAIDAADIAAGLWAPRDGLALRASLPSAFAAAGYTALELLALARDRSQATGHR